MITFVPSFFKPLEDNDFQYVDIQFASDIQLTDVVRRKCALRYDKKFAYIWSFDDGTSDMYTLAFRLLNGGYVAFNEWNSPGLFYNDAFGGSVKMTMSIHKDRDGFTQVGAGDSATGAERFLEMFNGGWEIGIQPDQPDETMTVEETLQYYEDMHNLFLQYGITPKTWSMNAFNPSLTTEQHDAIVAYCQLVYGYGVGGGDSVFNQKIEDWDFAWVQRITRDFVSDNDELRKDLLDPHSSYDNKPRIQYYIDNADDENHWYIFRSMHNIAYPTDVGTSWDFRQDFVDTFIELDANYRDTVAVMSPGEWYKYNMTFRQLVVNAELIASDTVRLTFNDANVKLQNGLSYDKAITLKVSHPSTNILNININGGNGKAKGQGTTEALIDVAW